MPPAPTTNTRQEETESASSLRSGPSSFTSMVYLAYLVFGAWTQEFWFGGRRVEVDGTAMSYPYSIKPAPLCSDWLVGHKDE